MAGASETLHEAREDLSSEAVELHRAIVSLMEELEAVDWYQQRVDATDDAELAAVLAHNRDEEVEHACMTLEWIRRRNPVFDAQLRTYLFTEGSILEAEHAAGGGGGTDAAGDGPVDGSFDGSLGIGDLRSADHG